MKREWIILLLSFVLTHCFAGEYNNGYKPMLSEGKVWNYILHTPYGDEKMSIEVKGDTTINNQECKKLYLKTSQGSWLYGCSYEIWPFSTVWVYPQIRIQEGSDGRPVISQQEVEEAVQRFAFWNNNKSPADIGESASQYRDVLGGILYMQGYYPYYVVYNYDLVEIRGNTLARVTVTGLPASEEQTGGTVSEIWFSGVGDSRWGIMHPNDGLSVVRKDWLELESCIEGDQCLYTNADINAEALQPEYHPFVEDNKVWAYDKNPKGAKDYRFYMRGDTIIGGRKCLKMYSENEYNDGKVNYKGAYYEENRQVFRYRPGEENAQIQYDFSLGLGETVLQASLGTKVDSGGVQSFANIMVMDGGVPYRVLAIYEVVKWANREKIEVTDDTHTGAWIEGVGPAFMLDVGYLSGFGAIGGRWGNGVQYCSVNGKIFYRSPWYKGQTDIHQPAFVEDGKVWKVGALNSGNPVQWVEYYYFDGDTIIDGKTCKQMMCQQFVNPDYARTNYISQDHSLNYVGAWYEENKKVYFYDSTNNLFKLMYDFSLDDNSSFKFNNHQYVVGPKQTGGLKGFKGVYRDVRLWIDGESFYSVPWLEGVGGTDRPTTNVYPGVVDPMWFLMSCTIGDEVIYLNDDYEDGATPEGLGARKRRFDFTHTIKTQPKARQRSNATQLPYGEYNDLQLGINLDPLDDAYQVRITDESGKVVYEKSVNAGTIVGLNIDISSYAKGRYTVTVENSTESFTGEFEAQTTGIRDVRCKKEDVRNTIYNLQGQRLSTLQKGLNIVNGQKVYVK